ncbi:MAG: hypothetical protein HYW90_03795 [Candidatus Sungbacteria bacterium]|nr:hypothetical protein [Candidatus Sungbacteria bacterium]
MRRVLGVLFILAALLAVLAGVGWRTFSRNQEAVRNKVIVGDYSGALENIAILRAALVYQAARFLPGVEDEITATEAWAFYKLGDRGRSTKLFRELAGRNTELGAVSLFNAATLELAPESFEKAIRDYEKVLKSFPSNLSAQRNLEILRQIEEEERKAAGSDGGREKDGSSGDGDKDKNGRKQRSRTRDKLEYRDGGDSDGQGGSSTFRY